MNTDADGRAASAYMVLTPHRPRAALLHKVGEVREDLTVLIRRARKA